MTEAELHQKLQLCRAELLDSLQFDMMSPALIQEGIISPAEYEGVQGSQSNTDKIIAFLDLLQTKNIDILNRFLKYLEQDYDWLAFSLKNTQIPSEHMSAAFKSNNPPSVEGLTELGGGPVGGAASPCPSSLHSPCEDEVQRRRERELRGERLGRLGCTEPTSNVSGGYSSPLHSSQFSLSSASSTADITVSRDESPVRLAEPLTEDMISLVVRSPAVVRRWQVLARRAGLANRIQVIQGRIRAEGRDHDEHVSDMLREWIELKPEAATLGGLIEILRKESFNDTALKLQNGKY